MSNGEESTTGLAVSDHKYSLVGVMGKIYLESVKRRGGRE